MRVYILILSLIISGCGLKKKNNRELPKLVDIESKKTVNNKTINTNDLNYIDFYNLILYSSADIEYNNSNYSFDLSFRFNKNNKILISGSLILSLFKILIQPEIFLGYQKIDKTYFESNFSEIYKKTGLRLNFNQIESILLGNPLINIDNSKDFKIYIQNEQYLIYNKEVDDLSYNLVFDINNTRLINQEINQQKSNRYLKIYYDDFVKFNDFYFPRSNKIIINDGKNLINLNINNRSKNIEENLSFPFKIPANYSKIKI